jgi:flagellar protein FliJ
MARPSPLKVLVELAEHRSQDVARTLGQLIGHGEQGEAKLQVLRNYLMEYRARLDEAVLEGIDGERLRNYLAFIGRLERAIADQAAEVARAQARIAQEKEHWFEKERERRTFETLLARRQLETKRLEARREQNQLDELSSGTHARRSNRTTL